MGNCESYLAPPFSIVNEDTERSHSVAASLSLQRWPLDMDVAGSTIHLDELLSLCERLKGVKFSVTTLSRQDIDAQISTVNHENIDDMLKGMWLELKKIM